MKPKSAATSHNLPSLAGVPDEHLFTRAEVAAILHLSPGTVANIDSQGKGVKPRILVGRQCLYPASSVRSFLASKVVA